MLTCSPLSSLLLQTPPHHHHHLYRCQFPSQSPPPPLIAAGMVTQGEALWREGEKPHQPRTASAITDAIVCAGFFSGHSTPWKRGGSCCASHSPLRGEPLTGVEKPFRSFSERLDHLIQQHSAPFSLDRGPRSRRAQRAPASPLCRMLAPMQGLNSVLPPPHWADSKTKLVTTVKNRVDISRPTLPSYNGWCCRLLELRCSEVQYQSRSHFGGDYFRVHWSCGHLFSALSTVKKT